MEEQSNDIAQELTLLHSLHGGDYSRQLERIPSVVSFIH